MADALDSKGGHSHRSRLSLTRLLAISSEKSSTASAEELLHFCCTRFVYVDLALDLASSFLQYGPFARRSLTRADACRLKMGYEAGMSAAIRL